MAVMPAGARDGNLPKVAAHRTRDAQGRMVQELVPRLLAWFSQQGRELPWRRTRDPYPIWVSEIMLQQTQVKTVIPYWERWLRELPTIPAVANAAPAKLHKLWEGLGYYSRVRNLQAAAKQITREHGGQFPGNFEEILALPGIGRYTAGAIASIAFNQPRPILDGNVIRVLTRIHGIAMDPRAQPTNRRLWQLAEELVLHAAEVSQARIRTAARGRMRYPLQANNRCSYLNQALMELGALVCTPRTPDCGRCPVAAFCVAGKQGQSELYPNLGKRKPVTVRRFIAFVIAHKKRWLVRQRPTGGVNAQLWEFPNVEIPGARAVRGRDVQASITRLARQATALPQLRLRGAAPAGVIKHAITRYRITMEVWAGELVGGPPPTKSRPVNAGRRNASVKVPAAVGRWLSRPQLDRLAFSSAHRRILATL